MAFLSQKSSSISGKTPTAKTRAEIEAAVIAVGGELDAISKEGRDQLDYCLSQIMREKELIPTILLAYVQHALRLADALNTLPVNDTEKLIEIGRSILKILNIRPGESRLDDTYQFLNQASAGIARRSGKPWDALLHAVSGRSAPDSIAIVEDMLNAGNTTAAECLLQPILNMPANSEPASFGHRLALIQTKIEMLKADRNKARLYWSRANESSEEDIQLHAETKWIGLWIDLVFDSDFAPVARAMRQDKENSLAPHLLGAWFWLKSSAAAGDYSDSFPAISTMRKHHEARIPLTARDQTMYSVAKRLVELEDRDVSLFLKIEQVKDLFKTVQEQLLGPWQLLALAAVGRWLLKHNQMVLATCIVCEYMGLSRKISLGRSEDVLHLFPGFDAAKLLLRYAGDSSSPQIIGEHEFSAMGTPHSLLELSKVATQISLLAAKGVLHKTFSHPTKRKGIQIDTTAAIADVFATFLQKRKGVLLKVGQLCSYFDGPIMEHVAERLVVLQSQVAAMPFDLVQKQVETDFGRRMGDIFAEFERRPFAAGGIGQVHLAKSFTGDILAVKVQYPHLEELFSSELKMARFGKFIFKGLLPGLNYDEIVEEVRSELMNEADFNREQDNIMRFRSHFADDPDIEILAPIPDLCTKHVLTTEFAEGESLYDFAKNAPLEQRERAAASIARFMFTAIHQYGLFYADPHPGNFLFRDGKVVVLDFGCIRRFDESYFNLRNQVHRSYFLGDDRSFLEAFFKLEHVGEGVSVSAEDALSIYAAVNRFATEAQPFRFDKLYSSRMFRELTATNPLREHIRLPKGALLNLRLDFGLPNLLAVLDVAVDYRSIFLTALGLKSEPQVDSLSNF